MIDPSKPDLEETVNVTEAHDRVVRGAAAAARENKLKENGAEPVSLTVMLLCAIPLLSAGWALGNAGTLFSYKDTVKDGYVRLIPADDEAGGPPPKEALAAYMAKGAKLYSKCSGCHGPDGKGDGNAYPSLAGSAWVTGENERLAMLILNGLVGPASTGKVYGVMPAQGAGMKGEDLAALMTYVRNSFGNKTGDVITKQMGTAALEISDARPKVGTAVTGEELNADHKKDLPGDSLDPKMMLDPITLEPAEAKQVQPTPFPSMSSHAATADHHGHDDHHHDPGFWKKYVFSTDHKTIGIQYGLTAMVFLAFGFYLMMVMRWSIAYPHQPLPEWMSWLFSDNWKARWLQDGKVTGETYNMFGAMHGTIMVFLGIVPLGFGAFGNYVTPLQIGAIDMAFPKLNMTSYWLYLVGGLVMCASFFMESGAAKSGWTNYSPLAGFADGQIVNQWLAGQTQWLIGLVLLISSSLLGSVNFITTIINLRARGMTWMRLPFFVWAMLVTAFLLLLAFPPLEAAGIMQLMDRVSHSSFFMPSGLYTAKEGLADLSGGGSPLLYQHLFWFLGHPEVYVLLLPAIACVAEIIPVNTRRPLWGYKSMVYGVLVLGFLSFIVWAHHMYLTGMGPVVSTFFQVTTVLISIPSVILITSMLISLWGGSIRFTPAMVWACAFLPMFGIGGLTGLPLAFNLVDLHLHDTYYVIGHFHYVVAPGILFGLFAGVYHWYPKVTGRHMSSTLSHIHFWPSLVCMNLIFFPMLTQGMAGFHRRWYNGGDAYLSKAKDSVNVFGNTVAQHIDLNIIMSWAAWFMALAQVPFVINLFLAWKFGRKVESDNPYNATTLEWATPTPPGHGNFLTEPVVYRGPYEYSRPDCDDDFLPQWEAPKREAEVPAEKPTTPSVH